MIFRLCYIRDCSPRTVTCSAKDSAGAVSFGEMWEKVTGCPVLTIQPLGMSKFHTKIYRRKRESSRPLVGGCESAPGLELDPVQTSADFGF